MGWGFFWLLSWLFFPSPQNRATKFSSLNPNQGKQHFIIITYKKRQKAIQIYCTNTLVFTYIFIYLRIKIEEPMNVVLPHYIHSLVCFKSLDTSPFTIFPTGFSVHQLTNCSWFFCWSWDALNRASFASSASLRSLASFSASSWARFLSCSSSRALRVCSSNSENRGARFRSHQVKISRRGKSVWIRVFLQRDR